jgi:hypothetical protein
VPVTPLPPNVLPRNLLLTNVVPLKPALNASAIPDLIASRVSPAALAASAPAPAKSPAVSTSPTIAVEATGRPSAPFIADLSVAIVGVPPAALASLKDGDRVLVSAIAPLFLPVNRTLSGLN